MLAPEGARAELWPQKPAFGKSSRERRESWQHLTPGSPARGPQARLPAHPGPGSLSPVGQWPEALRLGSPRLRATGDGGAGTPASSTRGAQRGSPHSAAWGRQSSAEELPAVCGQNEGHEGQSRDPRAFLPFLGCPGPATRGHVHAVHSRGVFSPVPGLMTPGRTWGWDIAGHGGQPLEPQHLAFPGGQRWSRGRAGLGLGHREAPDLPALGEGPWPWSAVPTG